MGPLLYHFADIYGQEDVSFFFLSSFYTCGMDYASINHLYFQEMSIELSMEDVKRVALNFGFQFEVILVHICSVAFAFENYSICIDVLM